MKLTERNENLRAFFDLKADGYDDVHAKFVETKALLAANLPEGAKKILDLGAGTGMELIPLFEKLPNAQVTAVDLSEEMLAQLRARPFGGRVRIIRGDFFESDLGSGYDAIISTSALHHFDEDEKLRLYKKLRAILKDGGIFLNSDYVSDSQEFQDERLALWRDEPDAMAHIDTPLTPENERRLLLAAGFAEVEIRETPVESYRLIIAK